MRKIFLIGLFLLLGFSQAFSAITKTIVHALTTGGSVVNGQTVPGSTINGTTIPTGQTITSDSVYQAGSISFGYSALAVMASGASAVNPNLKISYQTSYDNVNWFSPISTTGNGLITAAATLDSGAGLGNTWIVYNYTVYPYIRFNFQNNSATPDTITAESLWQDYI